MCHATRVRYACDHTQWQKPFGKGNPESGCITSNLPGRICPLMLWIVSEEVSEDTCDWCRGNFETVNEILPPGPAPAAAAAAAPGPKPQRIRGIPFDQLPANMESSVGVRLSGIDPALGAGPAALRVGPSGERAVYGGYGWLQPNKFNTGFDPAAPELHMNRQRREAKELAADGEQNGDPGAGGVGQDAQTNESEEDASSPGDSGESNGSASGDDGGESPVL
ncbi:hypothetical protein MKZ38_000181 [Zalerion maritima]|uniref:Uncharacterized protein n=1 Tax=Zalerion maritima TaxID=339359 RepID=A0AAD5RFV3_9PEZI|nr:hypothetical protein MKZ38_000181 [Zalerion maritima]